MPTLPYQAKDWCQQRVLWCSPAVGQLRAAHNQCVGVLQDINSQSWMVRMYYKHRLFMGACCISCEVLYLSVRFLTAPR